MIDLQLLREQAVDGLHVVANRRDREARAVERLGRVAGRRRAPVAEELGQDEEVARRVERAILRADQPVVAIEVRHVMGREKDGVVARSIRLPHRGVDQASLRQDGAAFGMEIVDDEFAAFERRRLLRDDRRSQEARDEHQNPRTPRAGGSDPRGDGPGSRRVSSRQPQSRHSTPR